MSDPALRVASPVTIIRRGKFSADAAQIADLVESRNIGGFVVGLPLNMDGTEGRRVQATRDPTAESLRDRPADDLPGRAHEFPGGRARMITEGPDRAKRRKAIDLSRRRLILQAALDALPDTGPG